MKELSTELHLCQRPMFRAGDGSWHTGFWEAVQHSGDSLTWDAAAVMSVISFDYIIGDMTLFREVTRQPWLSRIGGDGTPVLSDIPPHGRLWNSHLEIAKTLGGLLYEEARRACAGRREIYVTLSGGLDSRIVAATAARLYRDGHLECKPVCVTWGLENSRDVVYARLTADFLGLDWIHVNIGPGNLLENIDICIDHGGLFSPWDYHRMSWFKNVSSDALVLAGSYGDQIGRAVFRGRHNLELDFLAPSNRFALLRPDACARAHEDTKLQLAELRARAPGEPKYVICEHEGLAHYMRSMIAQAMSSIGEYCDIYQMFTDPKVYSYMWSIHPSLRNDNVYAHLLELLDERIARIPWSHTNRALRGRTVGARKDLNKEFHSYPQWICGPLYEDLCNIIDPGWFAGTGLFDAAAVERLKAGIRGYEGRTPDGLRPYHVWLWLAGFRGLAERLCGMGKKAGFEAGAAPQFHDTCMHGKNPSVWLKRLGGRSAAARNAKRKVKLYMLKRQAVKEHPPLETEEVK